MKQYHINKYYKEDIKYRGSTNKVIVECNKLVKKEEI